MMSSVSAILGFTCLMPGAYAHGWAAVRNEHGERIESRNSVAWKSGTRFYPNPHGMSQTNSASRPMYCGGNGQNGNGPIHDQISASDALQKAQRFGFATKIRKGSNFTLENWITANHGGVGALWVSCPSDDVNTPEGYEGLDWQLLTPTKDDYPANKRNGVGFSDKMPEWYGFAGSICDMRTYSGGVLQDCDDCQLHYGGPQTVAAWQSQKPPSGAPIAGGQKAMYVDIKYQLPPEFECKTAVFSWMWQTPHLCLPKEVMDKGAAQDFWKFCNRETFPWRACDTEWQGEIFNNCIDAEVVDDTTVTTTTSAVSTTTGTTTTLFTTTTSTTAATTTTAQQLFQPVDGGEGRACRGATSTDNAASYYVLQAGVDSLEACQARCLAHSGCKGIEYNPTSNRCEVWTKLAGIEASIALNGYLCFSYIGMGGTTTTTTTMGGSFQPVDGGVDRACRGSTSRDNSADYYTVLAGVASWEDCQTRCLANPVCKGIEYNPASLRCEVWTRTSGIEASVRIKGYSCYRFHGSDGCRVRNTGSGATDEDCKRTCGILAPGVWPCSSDGPCECGGAALVTRRMQLRGRRRGHLAAGVGLLQQNVSAGKLESCAASGDSAETVEI